MTVQEHGQLPIPSIYHPIEPNSTNQDRLSSRFLVDQVKFSFHRQYNDLYRTRLSIARPYLVKLANSVWKASSCVDSNEPLICNLADLVSDRRCVITGILYKEMSLKPSIVKQLAARDSGNETELLEKLASVDKLVSPTDQLFVEDGAQRIRLDLDRQQQTVGDRKPTSVTNLVTGVPVAILGLEPETEPGVFHVEDLLFINHQLQQPIVVNSLDAPPLSSSSGSAGEGGPWIALVSGLAFSNTNSLPGHAIALDQLADWLRTTNGIVRLAILGDSISSPLSASSTGQGPRSLNRQALYLTRNAEADSVSSMTRFDQWLASLPIGPDFCVDLLPGSCDPTSRLLPQQPIHPAVLPKAVCLSLASAGASGLSGRTNPCLIDQQAMEDSPSRLLLLTAGQSIGDLGRLTNLESSCDRMEATLLWGHLAPTCPDTLPVYPMNDSDPLLLTMTPSHDARPCNIIQPDIYAAGCQPEADWRRSGLDWDHRGQESDGRGPLLVAVPRFDQTQSIVLVNLASLTCQLVRFSAVFNNLWSPPSNEAMLVDNDA